MESEKILRRPAVLECTGLAKSSLYRQIQEGTFPRPVRIGKNSVGWKLSVVQEWIASLPEVGADPEPATETQASPSRSRGR